MSNDFILSDARELLRQAQSSEAVKSYYRDRPLGAIWQNNETLKTEIIQNSRSFDEAISRFQKMLYAHSNMRRDAERAVWWHLAHARRMLPRASALMPEDLTIAVDGIRYWHDDFRHAATVDRMARQINIIEGVKRPMRLLELGAGCGNLARLICQRRSNVKYVIVDLPDTLIFAMMFLRAEFPEARWQFPADGIFMNRSSDDFWFIPVGHESILEGEEFDAFINTASLGEMKTETVKYWMDFATNKIAAKHIFSVNRFLNTITPQEREWRAGDNGHAFMFDPHWEITDFELGPDFLRCPWQNRHARQLLCFGRKRDQPIEYDAYRKDAVAGAISASWNNGSFPESMTINDPPLNCDFTLTGPLYALWEGYRLAPSPQTKAALWQYMGYLCGASGRQFEDEIYEGL